MKFKVIALGSFLAATGGLYALLSIVTGSVIFEPNFPPIFVASVGGLLMVMGMLMS